MGTTNSQSGTNINEIADGIYRINTPLPPKRRAGRILVQPISDR
jgi:hypothetical protein